MRSASVRWKARTKRCSVAGSKRLSVEPGRQVGANLVQDFLEDVEVVDEPFGRRRRHALLVDDGGERPVAAQQDPPVLPVAREQARLRLSGGRDAVRGDRLGQLFEALDAQKLRANGLRPEQIHRIARRSGVST
jgi:hypothetical protein